MDETLRLRIVLRETNIGQFYQYADEASDPRGPRYGHYLQRADRADADRDLEQCYNEVSTSFSGMSVQRVGESPLLYVDASKRQLADFFGEATLERFLSGGAGSQIHAWEWPAQLSAYESHIRSIHLAKCGKAPSEDPRAPRPIREAIAPVRGWFFSDMAGGRRALAGRFDAKTRGSRLEDGITPQMLREYYNFPEGSLGEGQTIAIMSIGTHEFRRELLDDLALFWEAVGASKPQIEFVEVGPRCTYSTASPLFRLEASMGPAWIGALLPRAKIVVYELGLDLPDPWLAAVEMAVSDRQHSPNVLCMTWTTPEETYYRQFNRGSMALALAKAAALGITVVAASGDWGVYDGRPGAILRDDPAGKVARAAWPHATFPSSEDRVLSVGGTLVTALHPQTEVGWSGPLPPGRGLAKELAFISLATSGGFSQRVPIPDWQLPVVVGTAEQRSYSRGSTQPAVLPYGRGYPDVALMASGPALALGNDEPLSAMGYRLVIDGQWIAYAGGTSMAAPIWASVIAAANAARVAVGKPTLGFVNPLVYYLGQTRPDVGPYAVLRKITNGDSDLEFRVVNGQGQADHHTLAGYRAKSRWDPLTGLGVPNVANFTRAVLEYPEGFQAKPAPAAAEPATKPV